jgi:hypothetical protein
MATWEPMRREPLPPFQLSTALFVPLAPSCPGRSKCTSVTSWSASLAAEPLGYQAGRRVGQETSNPAASTAAGQEPNSRRPAL